MVEAFYTYNKEGGWGFGVGGVGERGVDNVDTSPNSQWMNGGDDVTIYKKLVLEMSYALLCYFPAECFLYQSKEVITFNKVLMVMKGNITE